MRKFLIIMLLIGSLAFMVQMTYAVDINAFTQLNSTYSLDYLPLMISTDSLDLPDDGKFKVFSPRAQERLLDLASHYGEDESNLNLNMPEVAQNEEPEGPILLENNDTQFIKFKPLPGVQVDANYDQDQEDLEIETRTNINLEYKMNERTLIRAGYGLTNREWLDKKQIFVNDSEEDTADVNEGNDEENMNDSEKDKSEETEPVEPVAEDIIYNEARARKSNIGISYQTSDRVTISADYIDKDIFSEEDVFSTIFGVEYSDEENKLRAKYKVGQGENMKETVTGLELDLKDLATFSASYKLLDPDQIEDQLRKESVWDFGLDLSLSDLSSLSLGYQLIDEESVEGDKEDNERDREASIKASFQIKF